MTAEERHDSPIHAQEERVRLRVLLIAGSERRLHSCPAWIPRRAP